MRRQKQGAGLYRQESPRVRKVIDPIDPYADGSYLDDIMPVDYLLNNCQGGLKYSLESINSIIFKDGKIYNLLEKSTIKKTIKCGCIKSSCQAKYCECFRWGETCTDLCECLQCKNKKQNKMAKTTQHKIGCNCVKSSCLKKYCQCFQNNKKCVAHCKCVNCKNID